MNTRREFLRGSGVTVLGAAVAPTCYAGSREGPVPPMQEAGRGSAGMLVQNLGHPQPATFDRLPLAWHQATVRRLQEKLGQRGLDGILIENRWNIIYFTGLFHTTTERPFACFIPTRELAVYWFYPRLDAELVKSWWFTDGDYYYDFPHTEGGFPDQGKVAVGPAVDLLEWMLKGIARRGFCDKKIGLDGPPAAKTLERMRQILSKAAFEDVGDICTKMRRVKTREEIALTQRACDYFSQIHAWTRDYILKHGTDLTDFKIRMAATEYAHDLILKDIKQDGHPHTGVGIEISIGCRTGVGTAYPHPNQFHYNKVKKGDSLQVAGSVKIGGCGGELYVPYQIAPWDADREKMWEVMAEGAAMQVRLSKSGTRCQEIARAVHEFQLKNGMQKYLYQRVAHGEGMEGHQEPYVALGDETVLEEGMTFSVEPGLFNPEGGYGYNPSDMVLVARDKGIAMGSVPLTKEWCFLKL
jgi:Xaa-Pro dipeptidase